MQGYNDDLVMSYSIALWIRDTALRLKQERDTMQHALMDSLLASNKGFDSGFSKGQMRQSDAGDPWNTTVKGEQEDLTWLL